MENFPYLFPEFEGVDKIIKDYLESLPDAAGIRFAEVQPHSGKCLHAAYIFSDVAVDDKNLRTVVGLRILASTIGVQTMRLYVRKDGPTSVWIGE